MLEQLTGMRELSRFYVVFVQPETLDTSVI